MAGPAGPSWLTVHELRLDPYWDPIREHPQFQKLRDYCLSPSHPRGRHKARVFARKLGLMAADAELLRGSLLVAAREINATRSGQDAYGVRYVLDFTMVGPEEPGRSAATGSFDAAKTSPD